MMLGTFSRWVKSFLTYRPILTYGVWNLVDTEQVDQGHWATFQKTLRTLCIRVCSGHIPDWSQGSKL